MSTSVSSQPTPEPLIKAEAIRAVLVLVVGAIWVGVELPDPLMSLLVDLLAGAVALGVSWALTMIARGKVWALRRGVDVDALVDEVQRRT